MTFPPNKDANSHTPSDPVAELAVQSFQTEQRVLGSIMLHPQTWDIVVDRISQDDFAEDLHKIIFCAIEQIVSVGKSPNVFAINSALARVELPDGATVKRYIANLAADAALPCTAASDADTLREFGRRREMIAVGRALIDDAAEFSFERKAVDVANGSLGALQAIVSHGRDDYQATLGAGASSLMEYIRSVKAGGAAVRSVPTGFLDIDSATGGYESGTLWVLGARPGVGKTVFAVSSSLKVARSGARSHREAGVGFGSMLFSLEVPALQINSRYLSDFTYSARRKIEFGRISRGNVTDDEQWELEEAEKAFQFLPLTVDSSSRLTLQEIKSKVRCKKAEMAKNGYRLGVVFIDYLKFVKATDRYKGQRVYEVGEISAGLKELAKEEDLCVVLLAQLNRALENRDDKRPALADLRESGDLEADADVVAFIHREAAHIERSPEYRNRNHAGNAEAVSKFLEVENDAEIIIGKNRAGPTPLVKLWCDVSCSTLSNKAREDWR